MRSWIIIVSLLVSACNGFRVDKILRPLSPYETYLEALESSQLESYAIVQDWKLAGQLALEDTLLIKLPYHEITYFDKNTPKAISFRYAVDEGHEVQISLNAFNENPARFFLDVFEQDQGDNTLKKIHSADTTNLTYSVKRSGIHAIRIQPELFRGGIIEVNMEYQGSLAFPILGKTSRNVASFWGDPRDANVRKHEGIDVFASRGTPVLAASEGRIRRVGNNRLGGKVVWLYNSKMGHSQYYAHLDSQAVSTGQRVNEGDTIGFVGNTGNAVTTAPHLHFGIYKGGRGAVDPLPFVQEALLAEPLALKDTSRIGDMGIIIASLANIRAEPNTSSPKLGSFPRNTLLWIEGKTGNWFRVVLPDGQHGFIYENLAEISKSPIQEIELSVEDQIREQWSGVNLISGDIFSGIGKVWGFYDDEYYVETPSGFKGWVQLD